MSVWQGIDRTAFEHNLSEICNVQKIQDASKLQALHGHDTSNSVLSCTIEKDLADSFAILAATNDQPAGVTASAMCQSSRNRLCIVIAANQGIKKPTADTLHAVVGCLKQQAARAISAQVAEHTCRGLILDAHRDRIFSRLGSAKARSHNPTRINIGARARSICELLERQAARREIRLTLQSLVSAIDDANSSVAGGTQEKDALYRIAQLSFTLMYGTRKLFDTLHDRQSSKEYRALRALANYWRICRFLVKCTKRYRSYFRQLDLEIIIPSPVRTSNGLRRYIHAEVQIVIHLGGKRCVRSRYIASSKKPCFLCYCFVRAHGVYGLSQSHGEIYEMWTVPDDHSLHATALSDITQALKITTQDVSHALSQSTPQQKLYLHPIQTMSKILLDRLSSAPSSTAAPTSVKSSSQDLAASMAAMSIAAGVSTLPHVLGAMSEVSLRSRHDVVETPQSGRQNYILTDRVELFLDIGRHTATSTASMQLCAHSDVKYTSEQVSWIDVQQLKDDEEVTIAFPGQTEIILLLAHGEGQTVVQLRWL